MIKEYVKIGFNFLIFVALQVLLLHDLHLFRVATLFVYVYVIIKIPVNISRSQVIYISFLLGFIIDMFYNTLGMHASACTLAGFFRDPLIKIFAGHEILEDDAPSSRRLGMNAYMRLAVAVVILHHITLFLIESFSLFDPLFLTLRIITSVIFTSLALYIIEMFNILKKNNGAF